MLNVGGGEFLVILLVGLIVLGPQKLPEAARQIGRVMSELRKISNGFQQELRDALDEPVEDEARARGAKAVASHNRAAENARKAAAAVAKLAQAEVEAQAEPATPVDPNPGPGVPADADEPATIETTEPQGPSDEANGGLVAAQPEPVEPEEPWRASPAAAAGMYDVAGTLVPPNEQPEVGG